MSFASNTRTNNVLTALSTLLKKVVEWGEMGK
jgi:hypothetical protein